jgi:hypothetical protein
VSNIEKLQSISRCLELRYVCAKEQLPGDFEVELALLAEH